MNPDTRIVVSCYSGDKEQVEQSLDLYLHHECPVTIMSPTDAPVIISHPNVTNHSAGKRDRSGPNARERHIEFFKIMLAYPENFFLMHESDSVCVDPKIPEYLYDEPDTLWSNSGGIGEEMAIGFTPGCPHETFQAPWFLSRRLIEHFVAVAPSINTDVLWVDHYLVELAWAASQAQCKPFRARVLAPISGRIDISGAHFTPFGAGEEGTPISPELAKIYEGGLRMALKEARNGANMIHSVKNSEASHAIAEAYKLFLASGPV
jgi:hypothetical protein